MGASARGETGEAVEGCSSVASMVAHAQIAPIAPSRVPDRRFSASAQRALGAPHVLPPHLPNTDIHLLAANRHELPTGHKLRHPGCLGHNRSLYGSPPTGDGVPLRRCVPFPIADMHRLIFFRLRCKKRDQISRTDTLSRMWPPYHVQKEDKTK